MRKFAENTSVSVDRSQQEIKTLLTRYGASKYIAGDDHETGRAFVHFHCHDRQVRFVLQLPARDAKEFHWSNHEPPRQRNEKAAYDLWEQACRSKWRSLVLCIKAKLEAVASGICEFEDEFLAHIVLPTGGIVADLIRPQIENCYRLGQVPDGIAGFLPSPGTKK